MHNQEEVQRELLGKMEAFLISDDLVDKGLILDSIYKKVLSFTYSPSNAELLRLSLPIWKENVERYMIRFPDNEHLKLDARLALSGIIGFVLNAP